MTAAVSSSTPPMSNPRRGPLAAEVPRSVMPVRTATSTPSGAIAAKIAGHPATVIRRPPSAGPEAVPTAAVVPSRPMTRPRRSGATMSRARARGSAIITAAPTPCRARAADQHPQRRSERAEHGSEGEDDDADPQDASSPEDVAQVSHREAGRCHRQQVRERHPLCLGEGAIQVSGDRGERHVGGAGAEGRDQHAESEPGRA